MIGKLRGWVEEIYKEYIILNVNNVGYIIYIDTKNLINLKLEQEVVLYTAIYTYESTTKIYGFFYKEDITYLHSLIKVKGISYKMAANLIGNLTTGGIHQAIITKNDRLLKIEGIGEKLAKRIITELYDIVIMWPLLKPNLPSEESESYKQESILALVSLGYSTKQATQAVNMVTVGDIKLKPNDIIKLALKKL